ncbi:hypothetical protein C8R44DRAFT_894762 [Mycena epipterygia]|nr:hypothetical protein C8R44DRAFT_894762 [Mycena epipterygia]
MSVSIHTGSSAPSYRSDVPSTIHTFWVVGQLGVNAHGLFASVLQIRAITVVAPPRPRPRLRWSPPPTTPSTIAYTRPVAQSPSKQQPAVQTPSSLRKASRSNDRGGGIPEGAPGVAIVPIFTLGAVIGVVSPSPPSPYQSISITPTSGTLIYASMYDSEPMRDDAAVVLTGDGRHGASSDNPLTVVFLEDLSVEERKARPAVEDFASREIPLDRYVYYRLYNRDGETRSSAAFDSVHTALGRIERAHITPPVTVESLKSCIAKVEHKCIWKYADLYGGTAPRDQLGGGSFIGREMPAAAGTAREEIGAA